MRTLFQVLVAALFVGAADAAPPEVSAVSTSDPFSIPRAIEAAGHRGDAKIIVPAGTYRFPAPPDGGHPLTFVGLHDLEIDATGAVFVFTDLAQGSIRFEHCANVTLRGAVLINDPIPYSQGRIEAIAEDRKSFDVRVAKGYPGYLDQGRFVFDVFDPATRQWKPGTHDLFCHEVERLGPDRCRVHQSLEDQAVSVGDLVAWRGPGATDVEVAGCTGMRIEDVTVRGGKGFCIAENGGAGGNYYRYKVTYPPTPAGADEPPLMASNADAFHSNGVRRGPTLERCLFEGMGDDGVPIHGSYAVVAESAGARVVVVARTDGFCQPGDALQFMDERQAVADEATVAAIRRLPDHRVPPEVFPKDLRLFQEHREDRCFELTLDREIPLRPGGLVANPAACGGGFVVRDCTIRNHRARGMLIKAGPGLIEGCTVEGSTIEGIVISPEMSWWNEAGYAHDLVVRHNVIRHVGYWTQPSLDMAGALSVAAYERGRYVPRPGGHRNILIEGNRFENNDGTNVLISSAVGVTLRGNEFIGPMCSASDRGRVRGVDDGALIWLTECSDIHLADNRVSQPGPFLQRPVGFTESVTGTGLTDGVSSR